MDLEPDAPLLAAVASLVPNMESTMIVSATRLEPRVRDGEDRRPQKGPLLIRAVLTDAGKRHIMMNKKKAKYKNKPVFVQHDLTKAEQTRRKAVVPQYKALRLKGIPCGLPRDTIILDRKSLTQDAISQLLQQ